jgi:hypothetical protein
MIFETYAAGGSKSRLFGCDATRAAATLLDPGYIRVPALNDSVKAWREDGYELEQ